MIPVQIRRVSKYVYDVFIGTGFDNWARVKKNHWGYTVVKGTRLLKSELKELGDVINNHPNGGIDSVMVGEAA